MNPNHLLIATLLLFSTLAHGQKIFTLDPANDMVAGIAKDSAVHLLVPSQVLEVSIQDAMPQFSNLKISGIRKNGRSNYLIAQGKDAAKPEVSITLAILLVESTPGAFQTDHLVLSCSSIGNCRECSLPPDCQCNKGSGSCDQNKAFFINLKKVTMTLFD